MPKYYLKRDPDAHHEAPAAARQYVSAVLSGQLTLGEPPPGRPPGRATAQLRELLTRRASWSAVVREMDWIDRLVEHALSTLSTRRRPPRGAGT